MGSIAKKRSDFEHIVNARGAHPSDYLRYITFEKNVDALRRKRTKRLAVRYKGGGQRIIYSLYNRATRKFSGDLTLWMQYIDFARRDKAYKRLNDIFTAVARLHPTKPDIWILAATYFMDTQADMTNARSYMQRGLRFCKNSDRLWLEYAKLETIYIGKIAGRRKILGLDVDQSKQQKGNDNEDENMLALPQITAEDINPSLQQDDGVDELALSNLASAPVLTGAIPLAIFDSAMKQFQGSPKMARDFFDMFAEFDQLFCTRDILQHVLDYLQQNSPEAIETAMCNFGMHLFGCNTADTDLAVHLRDALDLISSAIQQRPHEAETLSEVAIRRLLPLEQTCAEIDSSLQKALQGALKKHVRALESNDGSGERIGTLASKLQQEGRRYDAKVLVRLSIKQWPANEQLQRLCSALQI